MAGAGRFRRLHFQIHHHRVLPPSDDNSFAGLIGAGIDFLVRHIWRHEDEITWAGLIAEFQVVAPAHPGMAANYVEDRLKFSVMMRPGFGVWLNDSRSGPQ